MPSATQVTRRKKTKAEKAAKPVTKQQILQQLQGEPDVERLRQLYYRFKEAAENLVLAKQYYKEHDEIVQEILQYLAANDQLPAIPDNPADAINFIVNVPNKAWPKFTIDLSPLQIPGVHAITVSRMNSGGLKYRMFDATIVKDD